MAIKVNMLPAGAPLMGRPGKGKSRLVKKMAKKLYVPFYKLKLAKLAKRAKKAKIPTKREVKAAQKAFAQELARLSKLPFVMATSKTLPYLMHLPYGVNIRAHKIIGPNMGPTYFPAWDMKHPIVYKPGSTHEEAWANTDVNVTCGKGLHVGTVEWIRDCYSHDVKSLRYAPNQLLAVVEFRASDIAVVPHTHRWRQASEASDIAGVPHQQRWLQALHGKFRLKRLRVLSVRVISEQEATHMSRPWTRRSRRNHDQWEGVLVPLGSPDRKVIPVTKK